MHSKVTYFNHMDKLIYYIGLVSFLLFTLNVEIIWYNSIFDLFKYIAFAFLTLSAFLSMNKYNGKENLLLLLVFCLVILVAYNSEQLFWFYTSFLLIYSSRKIAFLEIIHIHFMVSIAILLISFLGANLGFIEDKVVYESDLATLLLGNDGKRHSYGYVWPTDFANHASFICLSYWIYKKGILNVMEVAIFWLVIYITASKSNCRQASLCILVLLVFSWLKKKKQNPFCPHKTFFKYIMAYSVVICFGAIVWATLAFEKSDISWIAINLAFSGRLQLGQEAIKEYGIPLWGQSVEFIGGDVLAADYNYVDSSYVQALVMWGITMTTILIISYGIISVKALKRNDITLLVGCFVAAVAGMVSQYMFNIMYCPLLLALFAEHHSNNTKYQIIWQRKKI